MRAAVWVVFVLAVVGMSGLGRGSPRGRDILGADVSCEEQCLIDSALQQAGCDDRLGGDDRTLCHQAVEAQFDVCMRYCDD